MAAGVLGPVLGLVEAAAALAVFATARWGVRATFAVGFNAFFLVGLLYTLTAPAPTPRAVLALGLLAFYVARMDALLLFLSRFTAVPKLDARLTAAERLLLPVVMVNAIGLGYALPFYFAARDPSPLGLWDLLAVVVYLVGTVVQLGADVQKIRFKSRPDAKGRLLTTGFWALCRHPNYFGDFLVYVAFALLGHHLWAWAAPLLNFLQYRFDAIPKNEGWAQERYGEAWDAYA